MIGKFVKIGCANNRPDHNGIGCVPYEYEIARCAISNAEWCAFLNAVGVERAMELKLWHKDMGTGVLGGIARSRTSGQESAFPFFVTKPGWAKKPVVYVDYVSVCRYCNWLMTGDTEKGAYDLSVTPPRRLKGATYFLPTDDEWYKAAYWDASAKRYWKYPTRSDELPRQDQANYEKGDMLAVGAPCYLADVDAYADSPSPCGALQMGGNAWEFLEDVKKVRGEGGQLRLVNTLRGGSFGYTETGLDKSNRDETPYGSRCYVFGARIARKLDGWQPTPMPWRYRVVLFIGRLSRRVKRSLRWNSGQRN